MIVVDIEATGLDPYTHSLLSIGAIDFEHPDVQFYKECRSWDGAHIDPKALEINGFTLERVHDLKQQSEAELIKAFLQWVNEREDETLAGQNVHVDLNFLEAAAHRCHADINLAYRVVDLHSITYAHLVLHNKAIPKSHKHSGISSDFIMSYVGIPSEPKPHIGLNGAIWEAEAFSRLLYGENLFDQFKQYPVL